MNVILQCFFVEPHPHVCPNYRLVYQIELLETDKRHKPHIHAIYTHQSCIIECYIMCNSF